MSIYPCEVCGQVVQGSLDGFYLSLRDGPHRYFRKVRLCRNHSLEFLETHEKEWRRVHPMYGMQFRTDCARCARNLADLGGGMQMYIDIYMRGQDHLSYITEFCHECALIIIDSLELVIDDRRDDARRLRAARQRSGQGSGDYRREYREHSSVLWGVSSRQDHPEAPDHNSQRNDKATDVT